MFDEFCREAFEALEANAMTDRDKQFIEYGEYLGIVMVKSYIEMLKNGKEW